MSKTTIPKGGITADAIDATLIADDAISDEHIDITAITGQTALAEAPAGTDEFLISDGGVLKRLDASYIGGDNKPYFKVALSASHQPSANTNTKIQFNHRLIDPDSVFDTTNHRFLPTTAGKYFFHTNARLYSSDADSSMSLYLYKNGSEIDRLTEQRHTGQTYSILVGSSIQEANGSSDYFEVFAKINQNTPNITADPSNYTWTHFQGFKIIT